MSARYSTSPSLRLAIGNSRIRSLLHGLLCLLGVFCLYRLSQRGYPLLALLLLPTASLCWWRLARQGLAGAQISWCQGEWMLAQGSGQRPIGIHRSSACLPWIIYLAWRELANDRRGSVFLFLDSAPAEQLRGLRARLTLER